MSSSTSKNLALLKALVIGLGVMIIIAFGLLVYGLVTRMGSADEESRGERESVSTQEIAPAAQSVPQPVGQPAAPPAAGQPSQPIPLPQAGAQPFGTLTLDLPSGCRVEAVSAQGERRLVLTLLGSPGLAQSDCPIAILVDAETGQELGRIVAGGDRD